MSENTGPVRPEGEIVLYQPRDGGGRIRVLLEGETVWLSQGLLAQLYQTTKQNISLHIRRIYEEGELDPEATVKEYSTVRQEGSRTDGGPRESARLVRGEGPREKLWTRIVTDHGGHKTGDTSTGTAG